MFNPIPPQDPVPPQVELVERGPDDSFLAGDCRRILGFALKRGIILALIFGFPLGLVIGLTAPSPSGVFMPNQFIEARSSIPFWIIATIAGFMPIMIFVCAIAMSADVLAQGMARSSRRTARMVKKCLQRRFDSHL